MTPDPPPTDADRVNNLINQSRSLDNVQIALTKAIEAEAQAKRSYEQATARREALERDLAQQRDRIRKLAKEL